MPDSGQSSGEIPYFFRFFLFLCLLHTVEVTGSNPVSPTIPFRRRHQFTLLIGQGGWGGINRIRQNLKAASIIKRLPYTGHP